MATMVYMQAFMMMVFSDSLMGRLDDGRGLECLTAEDLGCTVAWGRQRPESWEGGDELSITVTKSANAAETCKLVVQK